MVSIIIPFYNSERFLERTIRSAIDQTYKNLEIILINDGSTDSSLQIAEKHCNENAHIKLFTTENLGPGNARNVGIKNASGEFLTFLDSDDALNDDAIQILLDTIHKDQSDIAVCLFTLYNKERRSFKKGGWNLDTDKMDGIQAARSMYCGGIASVVWAKLYRIEIIQKILFPVNLWFEDRPYLMECFLNTDKISFVNESLLKIYSNRDSITRRTVTKKRIIDLHLIYEIEIEILKRYNKIQELSTHIINHHIDVLLDTFFLIVIDEKHMENSQDQKKVFLSYIKKFIRHYPKYPHYINLRGKVILLLFNGLRVLPWKLVSFLGCKLFKKKYKGVKLLKNS